MTPTWPGPQPPPEWSRRLALEREVECLRARLADFDLAFPVVVRLLRDEYPSYYHLHEIAEVWGGATPQQARALKRVGGALSA